MENNELKHYGVLGMRWGVRRRRSGADDSEDSVRARRALGKNINEMSNKELQDANQRIRLEQEHKDLIRKNTVGKKIVTAILATSGTIVALKAAQTNFKNAGKSADWAIKKWQNRKLPRLPAPTK